MSESASPVGHRILVIDDEAVIGLSCQRILEPLGNTVTTCQDSRLGLEMAIGGNFDVIILDIVMPELDGLELLRHLREAGVPSEVVFITGYATVKTAVEAMRLGAADYVNKPFTPDELQVVVGKVLERSALIRENRALRREIESQRGIEGIVAESREMRTLFDLIRRVAPTDGTILITGESGTGKELVARAIHTLSHRTAQPFMACDCTALAPTLLESELFGHAKGSFTGAVSTKTGLFEAANRGTLFLDEVANMSAEIQSKLLRALESRRVRRVGETNEREVDIRLIAATNGDLGAMVARGEFREDLFYRLNVIPMHLPPLRDRRGDIPVLAKRFLDDLRKRGEVPIQGFTPQAMTIMERYPWPGNVRELRNIVERLAILCPGDRVEPCHLPPEILRPESSSGLPSVPASWEELKSLKRQVREAAVQELERQFLMDALARAEGNVTQAAKNVGIQRTNFHALLTKHGISARGLD